MKFGLVRMATVFENNGALIANVSLQNDTGMSMGCRGAWKMKTKNIACLNRRGECQNQSFSNRLGSRFSQKIK